VREHDAAGHVVAIVSGATKFVVRPLAERLGIPHMLYTRLEVEDGCFTGRVVDPICFEEGKIYWLQQLIEKRGSISPRATSTRTRSPIARCSISSRTRSR
jgi:putative phosphoserine phosphatase/1-acylglycerol-3-phosphate O-acyltransferase